MGPNFGTFHFVESQHGRRALSKMQLRFEDQMTRATEGSNGGNGGLDTLNRAREVIDLDTTCVETRQARRTLA